jgi:predicted PurR-regulated permease PerM
MTFTPAQRQTIAWTSIAVVAGLLVWLLSAALTPFVVAGVLAYALHPAVEWLVAQRVPRWLAVGLVVIAAILLALALVLLVVPVMTKELPLLRQQIPRLLERFDQSISPWLEQFGINISLDFASVRAYVLKFIDGNLEQGIATLLDSARVGTGYLLTLLGTLLLIPVVLTYLLMDWERLVRLTHDHVPPRMRPAVDSFLTECDTVLGQYLRGQLLVMLVLAVYYAAGLGIARFELAVPVGVFTGLAVCIPYVGFGLGLALALLAGMLQFGALHALIAVAVVYGLGQVLESFFLTPRLVGERIGLHPLVVIFVLIAFGNLFGFVGVLIALPVSAIGFVAVRRVRDAYLGSHLYLGD